MKLIHATIYEGFDEDFLEYYFARPFPDGPKQIIERLKQGDRKAGMKGKATTTYELIRDNNDMN